VADLIALGEELGFESAWLPDHVAVPSYAEGQLQIPFLEPLATCAWGLGISQRLKFGTDVLVAPYRNPILVAAMAGTLERLAGDRLILGVGIGYLKGEFDVLGASYADRATETESWLESVRPKSSDFSVVAGPVRTPIWVGGNARNALRRAALLGDGWHPLWMPPTEYAKARDTILALRQEHGREARFTFSFSAARTKLAERPSGGWPPSPPRAAVGSEFRYAPEPWVASDGRPGLVGSPDELMSDLRSLVEAGVDHITLRFGQSLDQMRRFAAEVMPAFHS
jgi:alkanesulfonate monooxygenase SsuD/methylene tetrahydromethanopterin reductase-like flavin-dependent oxidoreductase (luciferase family)